MPTVKRIICRNCKAHILNNQPYCGVCYAPKPKGPLDSEVFIWLFIAIWVLTLLYLLLWS